jgi:DNA-binding CsgD family transcriptional regulator
MLLERDAELALLADLLIDLDESGGKAVLLRGEAGVGKGALVAEFVAGHTDEAQVAVGACDDFLIPQPLGPFWDFAREEPSLLEPLRQGQLRALDQLESLGATAVAAKLRKSLRDHGLHVPRGKGRRTREHAAGLTARQAEVLQLLGDGLSNSEIADQLFVSPRTVENHVSAILTKLDASSRGEAVARAREQLLIAATA